MPCGYHGGVAHAAFTALTRVLLDAATVADVLQRILNTALDLVPGADLASITLRSTDAPTTPRS